MPSRKLGYQEEREPYRYVAGSRAARRALESLRASASPTEGGRKHTNGRSTRIMEELSRRELVIPLEAGRYALTVAGAQVLMHLERTEITAGETASPSVLDDGIDPALMPFAGPLGSAASHGDLAAAFARRPGSEPEPLDVVVLPDDLD